jgi:hypothetical protein
MAQHEMIAGSVFTKALLAFYISLLFAAILGNEIGDSGLKPTVQNAICLKLLFYSSTMKSNSM